MFAILHVLFNSSTLLNPVQSYHPRSHEYTDMQLFAMHCFQGCKGSLKSLSKLWGWAIHNCYSDFRSSACTTQQLNTVEPYPQVPIHTHVNTQMCNLLQGTVFNVAEHPWKFYASILGVSCPPLLHWCSQCCMCCSTVSHCWTLSSHITYTHVNT